MPAPGVERRALLISPFVALIDAHDPGAAAGDMVENGLRDLKPNTKLLQPRRHRSAKVVKAPVFDAAVLVQRGLSFRKTIEDPCPTPKDKLELVIGLLVGIVRR